jgi:hypothetical protein
MARDREAVAEVDEHVVDDEVDAPVKGPTA